MQRNTGYSLIELVICVAIFCILSGLTIPYAEHLFRSNRATVAVNWLVSQVVFARHAAITEGTTVTLCPSTDGVSCRGKWHDGTIVFTDHNKDHRISSGDRVLFRFDSPVGEDTITWRAFQNRQYLQMLSSGYTNYQNGNFVYCPADGDPHYARQLVINIQGRARTSKDTDGDGIPEDRRGDPLRC